MCGCVGGWAWRGSGSGPTATWCARDWSCSGGIRLGRVRTMDGAVEQAKREWPHLLGFYEQGASLAELADQTGLAKTTVRKYLLALGAQLREREAGLRLAFMRRMGRGDTDL